MRSLSTLLLQIVDAKRNDKIHDMSRYIVECSKDVLAPAYLRWNDSYDLKSVADPEHKCNMKPFHSLAENTWPRKEALGLDESQMRALRMALTKELTIIQGPPGTGEALKRHCWKMTTTSIRERCVHVILFTVAKRQIHQRASGVFYFSQEKPTLALRLPALC